jgi:hypothetical protein
MSNDTLLHHHESLSPNDQQLFAMTCRRLFTDGFIWREGDTERPLYNFIRRHQSLVEQYLDLIGWQLTVDERLSIAHVSHREGAHRYRFNRDTTLWLLVLRLLYAEQRESLSLSLSRHPTALVNEVYNRYAELSRNPALKKKTSFAEALRTLSHYKLIRAVDGGTLRATNLEQVIELLPILEIIIPATTITTLQERLDEYFRTSAEEESSNVDADEDISA